MRSISIFLLASLVIGTSCSSTSVTKTWADPTDATPLGDVLVVAVVRQDAVRRALENDLAAELHKRGVRAVPSFEALPAGAELSRDEVRRTVEQEQFDQVLVTNYEGIEHEVEYVPGTMGYYGYMGVATAWPGYYRETTTLNMRIQLFDAKEGGKLRWSAESSTRDPDTSPDSIGAVAKELVEELSEDVAI